VVGSTSGHENDTENNETNDSDDLQAGEPEFHLSKNPGTEEVDCEDENQEYRHVYSGVSGLIYSSTQSGFRIGRRTPITDDDRGGHNLYGNGDCPTVWIY